MSTKLVPVLDAKGEILTLKAFLDAEVNIERENEKFIEQDLKFTESELTTFVEDIRDLTDYPTNIYEEVESLWFEDPDLTFPVLVRNKENRQFCLVVESVSTIFNSSFHALKWELVPNSEIKSFFQPE